jgi:hypothetical protein
MLHLPTQTFSYECFWTFHCKAISKSVLHCMLDDLRFRTKSTMYFGKQDCKAIFMHSDWVVASSGVDGIPDTSHK